MSIWSILVSNRISLSLTIETYFVFKYLVAVIVTEYVEIAQAFFEGEESKIVNAVLDRIAKQVRGEKK